MEVPDRDEGGRISWKLTTDQGAVVDDAKPKRVTVEDRHDVGNVIQWGKNLGISPSIYVAVIYFPATGECRFYDMNRVTPVD